jgi:hypothetical protein
MKWPIIILTGLLLTSPLVAMEIRPVLGDSPTGPYRAACLILDSNDLPVGVDSVHIRWVFGGPIVVVPLPVATEAAELPILLPGMGLSQDFELTPFTGTVPGPSHVLTVHWPTDPPEGLLRPRWCRPFDARSLPWPRNLRLTALLVVGGFVATVWLVGWLAPRRWRYGLIVIISAITTAVLWGMFASLDTVVSRPSSVYPQVQVLTTVRSQRYSVSPPCLPVYRDRRDFMADDAIITPDSTTVTLVPGQAVLLHAWPDASSDSESFPE